APDGERVLAGGQHGDDRLDTACRIGGRRRRAHAARPCRLELGCHQVEALDFVALLDKVAGHRQAHVAQSDETYLSSGCILRKKARVVAPPPRNPLFTLPTDTAAIAKAAAAGVLAAGAQAMGARQPDRFAAMRAVVILLALLAAAKLGYQEY